LRLRDMPGGMRDGVLVPHITPHTAVESAARCLYGRRAAKCSSLYITTLRFEPFEAG
jgi:hypothetical protein